VGGRGAASPAAAGQISFDPAVSILDSFPMPVCRFGRDEGAKQAFYGLRAPTWGRIVHGVLETPEDPREGDDGHDRGRALRMAAA
jgi:hypothetical protein